MRRPRPVSVVRILAALSLSIGISATEASGADDAAGKLPPQNTSPPSIQGSATVGQTLTGDPGAWSGPKSTLAFQWHSCAGDGNGCSALAGDTGTNHAVTTADFGRSLRFVVVATNRNGSTTAASAPSAVVTAPSTSPPPPTTTAPVAPSNTTLPALSGIARERETLAASTGAWAGTTPMTYTYGWRRCDSAGNSCTAISGAADAKYVVQAVDVGRTLRAAVTASNSAGSATAASAASAVVTAASSTTAPAPSTTLGTSLPARMPVSSGSGGTYYVGGANASDANNGSATAPWQTINRALASVPLAGSVIKVRPGTYYSSGTSYVIKFNRRANVSDPITLMAETPGTVTIANANPTAWTLGGWIVGASGLRIEGLTFRIVANAGSNVGGDGLLIENSDRIEVTRNTFNEMAGLGITIRGGKLEGESADDVWILGNTFRPSSTNSYAQATGTSYASSMYFGSRGSHWVYAGQVGDAANQSYTSGTERLVVANNVFAGTAAGRHVELGPQARRSYVVNNTFFGNHAGDVIGWATQAKYAGNGLEMFTNVGGAVFSTSYNVAKNNLFVDLNGHGAGGSGPTEFGNLVANNMAYDLDNGKGYLGSTSDDFQELYGTSILFSEVGGNLRGDPLFASPMTYDFHLRAGSAAVGRADPAYAPSTDLDGKGRDAAPDIGAFEQ